MKNNFYKTLLFVAFLVLSCSSVVAKGNVAPPDSVTHIIDKSAAILLIDKARTLYDEGKVRDALIIFRQATVKDPFNWKAPFWVAQCHYSMNNYGLALKYAQEAVEIEKSEIDKDLYELLGRSYHRVGELDSAIFNYSRAISKLSAGEVKALNLEVHLAECKFAKEQQMGNAKSKRVAVSTVNSGYNDYSPILIENGKTLYFTSRRNDTKGGSMNPDDQEFFEDTYRAVWNAEINNWDSISNDLGRINTEGFDAINYISKDGNHGLMTVNTTATDMKNTTKGSDLFTIEMSNKGKWSTPKRINAKTINTSFFEGSATMTSDMNTLYFVSDRKGEKSSTDIYVSQKVGKNWGEAAPLPFTINTIGRETTPFISGDGRFLFFSSDGHLGMGGLDIYVVENLGSTWGEPINLGIIVNTVNNDTHFQYYPELQKAVMSSFEIIGQKASMDIFNVDMTDFMYPKVK
ncbi:MAG: hypothetical protein RL265_556 [Bacteroidota bacterium]